MRFVRQPSVKVDPRPILNVGDRVKFAAEKRQWTVRGATEAGRFVILTQPFNLKRTVLYTVVDFDRGVRGRDDHYGLGYESEQDIADAVHMFQHAESEDGIAANDCAYRGDWCAGSADVSRRAANHIRLDFQQINGEDVTHFGQPITTEESA